MKILLTGFEPFGGAAINPSWEAVRRTEVPAGTEAVRICLPVSFREARAGWRKPCAVSHPNRRRSWALPTGDS